jgi:hypothetical protein
MKSRERRSLAALATVALIGAGGAAGCGTSTPAETGTAGGTTSAGATATGSKQLTARDKAVKFAECVRANGVSDFPDPNADNDFEYGVSVSATVWTKAVDACKDLQPPGSLSSERDPKEQQEGLEFARCMRANGVKDFPDPVDGEPLINTYRIPSSGRSGGMTILNAGIAKCRALLAKAASGR